MTFSRTFAAALALTLAACPSLAQVGPGAGCTITSCAATSPSSTLTSGTATTLAAGQLIASSTTAGSIVVPSFTLAYTSGAAIIPKFILLTNATSGWSGGTAYIELWSAAPTFTNGDGGTYAVATGSASYLDTLTCTFGSTIGSATFGQAADGAYGLCVPTQGTVSMPKLTGALNVFWSLAAGSTLTKASGATFTLRPASALN